MNSSEHLVHISITLCSGGLPPMSAMSPFVAATATPFIGQTFSDGTPWKKERYRRLWRGGGEGSGKGGGYGMGEGGEGRRKTGEEGEGKWEEEGRGGEGGELRKEREWGGRRRKGKVGKVEDEGDGERNGFYSHRVNHPQRKSRTLW